MTTASGCEGCSNMEKLGFEFTMAFQPIVDVQAGTVFAHEALVRGLEGQGAASILSRITDDNRYGFDQACRVKAIELASALGMQSNLSINFLPNAVYRAAACIRLTLAAADRCNFPPERIIFELVEDERAKDLPHLTSIFTEYKQRGFTTAIDDFGAGYAGFELLAEFQPDIVKIDMHLVRNIHINRVRRAIVKGFVGICDEIGIRVLAEGVETADELRVLRGMGITLFQGYLLAKPGLRCLPEVNWDAIAGT